VEILETHRV